MNALDTNVLVYRLDGRDPLKQAQARQLLRQLASDPTPTILLWQVLGELVRQLRSWQDRDVITRDGLLRYVATIRRLFPLTMPTPQVIDHALELTGQFSLSHWDSMLLGACTVAALPFRLLLRIGHADRPVAGVVAGVPATKCKRQA